MRTHSEAPHPDPLADLFEEEEDLARENDDDAEAGDPADDAEIVAVDEVEAASRDVGDLYGAHTPPAVDRAHPDDETAFDQGETWLEALAASAAEHGAEPERELDIVDDEDLGAPHPSDTRDTPVADRGSGGPSGT